MSYMQLGAIDDKIKSKIVGITDKLGITKYAQQLFTNDAVDVAPAATPPPPPAEPKTPWLEYGLMAGAGLLIYKVLFK